MSCHITTTVPLISPASVSPEGSARGDRLRDLAARAERADRVASQLDSVCDDGERELREAVSARDDQQIAWLVLCDRGWPRAATQYPTGQALTQAWLDTWGEQVALPVRITSARDMVKLRQVRRRLERCELALRRDLPAGLWQIVDPLDDTGRATLAYVLHALHIWVDACVRCDSAAKAKERLAMRLGLFANHAAALGLVPPAAPLDVEGWRSLASAARLMALEARQANVA
jgi:hypothetical protein